MSNDSHPAKLQELCILFMAVVLLHGEFPDIVGLNLPAHIIYTIVLVACGIFTVAMTWILAEQLFRVLKMATNRGFKLTDTSQNLGQKAEPPILAEFLVGLCAKRRYRTGLLQNLEEDFESNLADGATVRRARRSYWAAALNSIGPQLLASAKRVGIIGLIADYARRLLH
jgi:hypothetical protein